MTESQNPTSKLIVNLLTLVGYIVILVVLVWGLVHLTKISSSWVMSFFDRDTIAVEDDRNGSNNTPPVTPNNNEEEVAEENTSTPTPAGTPDLAVTVLRSGMTGANEAYVVFDVANRGATATGAWHFTATLPTTGQSQYYVSPTQLSLAPGAHIENTLRFAPNLGGTFSVSADPDNRVRESNESNNAASHYLSNYNYYAPTTYPSYYY